MAKSADELDLRLIHALQIAPRAPWVQLAKPLGLSAATAARRWERLVERGEAWICGYNSARGSDGGAFIEIACEANRTDAVGDLIAASPQVLALDSLPGPTDLFATVAVEDISAFATFTAAVRAVRGVRSVRGRLITGVYSNAARWRLDALDPAERTAVERLVPIERSARPVVMDELDRRLVVHLGGDGRAAATDLANALGVSITTVRRRIDRLMDSSVLDVRCEVLPTVTGHAVSAVFWIRIPAPHVAAAAARLSVLPEVRLVAGVTGPENLLVTAWLRHAADIERFEADIVVQIPTAIVADRSVKLGIRKLTGRMIGADGRANDVVLMDSWSVGVGGRH
ncbi:Lrp/AsnC family transcriptional regulator [Tsukamurella sp. NPDC003166]|uniref:Lrp/AsnC family transcriptional regulator n=1 Tax=Tsukamurella sp. NPDC003166 TaxID=3154444 RepID=UPI0033B18E51